MITTTLGWMQSSPAQEPTLEVRLQLQRLRCIDEGDGIGSAEPYLWAVFFKIDGTHAFVDAAFHLQGTATAINTLGNHGNLPNHDVDPGEVISIPAAAGGDHHTRLFPIPLRQPVGNMRNVPAAMGCIVVLMEEDNTPGVAVERGHNALDRAVEDELNRLIPTLGIAKRTPTELEIQQMKDRIGAAVRKAVRDKVTIADWLLGGGNMDDQIGSEVFLFSTTDLANIGTTGLPLVKRWNSEGKWQLEGLITATRVSRFSDNVAPRFPVRVLPKPRRTPARPSTSSPR
ncbi:MAG TPA: hypothetical protein VF600_08960 [Abditibacteriaceae bacterium]|jgi:hypothetical protein